MIWIITYLTLMFLGLGIAMAKHGERRTDNYNFWVTLFSTAIVLFILYKGNFFAPLFG